MTGLMAGKVKILAVDDEDFNLDIIVHYLEEAGFEVIPAEDGDVALQKLASIPDVALVDLDRKMPRLDGIEVLREMKRTPGMEAIPVIIQTAVYEFEQKSVLNLEGAYGYLTKPYDGDVLVSLVRAALKNSPLAR